MGNRVRWRRVLPVGLLVLVPALTGSVLLGSLRAGFQPPNKPNNKADREPFAHDKLFVVTLVRQDASNYPAGLTCSQVTAKYQYDPDVEPIPWECLKVYRHGNKKKLTLVLKAKAPEEEDREAQAVADDVRRLPTSGDVIITINPGGTPDQTAPRQIPVEEVPEYDPCG